MVRFLISSKFLRHTPFWWWVRLISHEGFRFDDYYVWNEFWMSINSGWLDINYKWEFEKFWGKGAEPERVILSPEDYDALVERLNEPPDPAIVERVKDIMNRKAPWDDNDD